MRLNTDEWLNLSARERDALIATAIAGPASMKALTQLLYGPDHTQTQYVGQTTACQTLIDAGYIKRETTRENHPNSKAVNTTTDGELLLDRNVVEVGRQLR